MGVFTDRSALYKPKMLVKQSKTHINYHFIAISISRVWFLHMHNIKRVPGYKETDLDVQFVDNYQDNRVSVPALITIIYYNNDIYIIK